MKRLLLLTLVIVLAGGLLPLSISAAPTTSNPVAPLAARARPRGFLPVMSVASVSGDAAPTPPGGPPPGQPAPPVPAPNPAGASVYWGALIDGVPSDLTKLDTFEQGVGKPVSIVHWGQPWKDNGGYLPFEPELAEAVRARGSIPMINWGSWALGGGIDQPAFSLAAIARGDHDGHIRQWAAAAKAWGHPLFLRFDHEMNLRWQFSWQEQANGNQPGDFVRMWRHVHDLFTQVGATNVTWVWCPNITDPTADYPSYASLYPGDAYVDWVALDGYNWGTDQGSGWQSFAEVFGYSYGLITQLAPSKPVMIGEWASSEHGGDKAAWIRDALGTQLPRAFPRIKAVVWFNWADAGQTWPVESSPAAQAAFRAGIASRSYAANQFTALSQSPIPALR